MVQPNTGAYSSTFGVPENMQSVLSNADELLLIHLTKEKRSESLVCLNIQQNPQVCLDQFRVFTKVIILTGTIFMSGCFIHGCALRPCKRRSPLDR
ncbi:hypothetical protein DXE53_08860 [Escherichia coli O145]|nr:hypothetical protein DXE53_08860 [Escherichia coli O145]